MKFSSLCPFLKAFFVLSALMVLCSCAGTQRPIPLPEGSLHEYLPVLPDKILHYRVRLNDRDFERDFQWREGRQEGEIQVFSLSDSRGYTKSYSYMPESIQLKGISVLSQGQPEFYQGDNACLKTPLVKGHRWEIHAQLKTDKTTIIQTGHAEIRALEKYRTQAGEFDAIKVLFDVRSEYRVRATGEESVVTAQYAVWYGKGAGLLKQRGSAFIEKENRVVILDQELTEIRDRKEADASAQNAGNEIVF